jgi:hypothetical protein
MPLVGTEPKTPVFQRVKTVHAFDRAATMIGSRSIHHTLYLVIYTRWPMYLNHETK